MSGHGNTATCPPEILDWLPWYADDGLPESQRGAVEAHAAQCEACRTELAMLAGDVRPEVDAPDADRVFAKVLARIEASGGDVGSVPAAGHLVPAPARRAPLRPTSRPLRSRAMSRLAAAAALVLVGAIGWLSHDWVVRRSDDVYQTASGPADPVGASNGVLLDVVFRTGISIERINTDLRALGAVMVSGPSEAGRYRVALPAGSNPAAAAAMLRAEATGVATFAEPVRP
jgi:Putative zinc-finger